MSKSTFQNRALRHCKQRDVGIFLTHKTAMIEDIIGGAIIIVDFCNTMTAKVTATILVLSGIALTCGEFL